MKEATTQHSASVKIYKSGSRSRTNNIEIRVKTKSYCGDKSHKPISSSLINAGIDSKSAKFIESFIYDNQMAIIAFWYTTDSGSKFADGFEEYFKNNILENDYYKDSVEPKSDDKLELDKRLIENFIREYYNDSSITLYFGQ